MPTSTASAPASRARRASSGPAIALSLSTSQPFGHELHQVLGERHVAVVDLPHDDVAVVDAEDVGLELLHTYPLELAGVVHLDERLETELLGRVVQVGEHVLADHARR